MIKVLFVCLGNICRSPAAEGVMAFLLEKEGLIGSIDLDSAGTSAYHAGEKADRRMRQHAKQRGIELKSVSRQFQSEDFKKFDYIIAMDEKNFLDIESLDPEHQWMDKVYLMSDFCHEHEEKDVPDPYYGGAEGFETVLNMVTEGCENLLERIKSEL